MAKSVAQFVRGIDLTNVDLTLGGSVDPDLTAHFGNMSRLQWLKLRSTGITSVPSQLAQLERLEHLTLSKNRLERLDGPWASQLRTLRVVNCRKNQLTSANVAEEMFSNPELQVVDLSHNQLREVPRGLEKAKSLLVLNLSNNQLEAVRSEVFTQCTDLMFLDLSDNQLSTLPAQLRRCTSMVVLILDNNPLTHAQLRAITALKQLEVLHLANTERRLGNFPEDLDKLTRLVELNLADNKLTRIPEVVYQVQSLRKLNLSGNEISDLTGLGDTWPAMEYLNLSHNRISTMPASFTRLTGLRKLYLNDNVLTFNGLPSSMAKLTELDIFNAANNKLENIPEGLCRCGRLKRLILNSNNLLTLPDAIHYLIETLEVFQVEDNPNLVMPPKPAELQTGAGLAYYNIDFSLDTQMKLLRGKAADSHDNARHAKDAASRLRRLRRRRPGEGGDTSSSQVLEGMKKVARERDEVLRQREEEEQGKLVAAKRWQDTLAKPNLDYSKIFDEDVGCTPGLEMWVVDEFYPKRAEDETLLGNLYDGDCYIILDTHNDSSGGLTWAIYYWLGSRTTQDKMACAAMHAVNLRNLLGAECRTQREEQGDETPEFSAVFGNSITVLEGAIGDTGFLPVETKTSLPRLYRLFGDKNRLRTVAMATSPASLDPKFVYLLDATLDLFVWLGSRSRLMLQTKGHLLADKINMRERKGKATIRVELEDRESDLFWEYLTGSGGETGGSPERENGTANVVARSPAVDHIPMIEEQQHNPVPVIYDVKLGKGYLELPQVEMPHNRVTKTALKDTNVYIVDSGGELFVWLGQASPKFLRCAGCKLAYEMLDLLPRARRMSPILCTQGGESQIFRTQFDDWEDPVAVDYTRTAESILRRGGDLKAILEKDKIKVDLRAFFAAREKPTPWDEALQLMEEWNEELAGGSDEMQSPRGQLQQFIMAGRKWIPVEKRWVGHFFNQDSYIVIARYWDFGDEEESESEAAGGKKAKEDDQQDANESGAADDTDDEEDRTRTIVYFWQGRDCSDVAWLTFSFSLRKEMEERLSKNPVEGGRPLRVEFKRIHQQQEDLVFLAHFERQFVIHLGTYRDRSNPSRLDRVQMYHLRANGGALTTRCVEVLPSLSYLSSHFTYFVKVPPRLLGDEGLGQRSSVIVWLGEKADAHEVELIQELARETFTQEEAEITSVSEGSEPDIFWRSLGCRAGASRPPYDRSAEYMTSSRLFRLSNEAGYFMASEKCADFCQADLADEDVMMLDNGETVFLWIGSRTSDVELKLSLQAAKLYREHLGRTQPNKPRKLRLAPKNKEPHAFRCCFHGWGPFREPKSWSG